MRQSLAEILQQASGIASKADRIDYLKKNGSKPLMILLQYCFHPVVKWLLPEGEVPYKPTENWDDVEGSLYVQARKLYLFIEGGYPGNLTQTRREQLFIQLLEGVHAKDAALLVAIKDKKMPYAGITPEIVRAAFPGILP